MANETSRRIASFYLSTSNRGQRNVSEISKSFCANSFIFQQRKGLSLLLLLANTLQCLQDSVKAFRCSESLHASFRHLSHHNVVFVGWFDLIWVSDKCSKLNWMIKKYIFLWKRLFNKRPLNCYFIWRVLPCENRMGRRRSYLGGVSYPRSPARNLLNTRGWNYDEAFSASRLRCSKRAKYIRRTKKSKLTSRPAISCLATRLWCLERSSLRPKLRYPLATCLCASSQPPWLWPDRHRYPRRRENPFQRG